MSLRRFSGSVLPVVILLILTGISFPGEVLCQRKTDSPVFRSYKPPEDLPLLQQGDPTYQSWQVFLATRRANAGDPVAQQELALRYFTGAGVDADTVRAAFWMRKAAEQDLLQARFNLALFLYHGWGVAWDPFESYRQFLLCAERDVAEAEYAVGIFSIENLIMPEDWQKGYEWVKRAADAGYKPASDVVKAFEQRLASQRGDSLLVRPDPSVLSVIPGDTTSPSSREAALREALVRTDPETRKALGIERLAESGSRTDSLDLSGIGSAAESGSPEALALMGRRYQEGIGVAHDSVLAAVYYLRAVRMESARAGQLLWEMAQNGDLVRTVKERAEKGDPAGYYVWAGLLSLGLDVQLLKAKAYITPQQAVSFLRRSADAGYVPALIELGLWYYSGRWVQQDEARAEALWREAEKLGNGEAKLRLAVMAVRNDTVVVRLRQAVDFLHEASAKGAVLADVALGFCYEKGVVVPQSAGSAADLYRSAWRRGSLDAYRALRRLHDALRPTDPHFAMHD
jgi:uncharacterized protein